MPPRPADCLAEVEATLAAAAREIDPHKAAERAYFMKTRMPLLGLTVPQQRACLKKGYSFSALDPRDQLPIWDHIWNHARTHEARMQAGFFIEKSKIPVVVRFGYVREWVKRLNCWDQSDTLSHVVSQAMEADMANTLPVLETWLGDDNPWLRRQALVGLVFYARFRKNVPLPDTILHFVSECLADPDYYVQKGLGWCLRECSLVYPDETQAFLKAHARDLAPAAWQAATEKLPKAQKAEVKTLRQKR